MNAYVAGDGIAAGFDPVTAARDALAKLGRPPSVVLIFSARRGSGVAACEQVAPLAGGAPVIAVECGGVLASGGEREGEGVSVLALGGEDLEIAVQPLSSEPDDARAQVVATAAGATLLWLALAPPLYRPDIVASAAGEHAPHVIGGGGHRVAIARASEPATVIDGVAIALRSRRLRAATVSSPAARLLTPWRTLTEVQGPFLLMAGATPMAEWLAASPSPSTQGSPMFVAVRASDPDAPPLLRTIAGIDPKRGGVAVTEPVEKGAEIALAVWDGAAARQDLSKRVAKLADELGGGTPAAGFLMTCVGRGVDLFGEKDVDVEAVRSRFGTLPFAGMFSQFELARFESAPRIHLYTAAIAVLYRPS